jgi:hypothetical protein
VINLKQIILEQLDILEEGVPRSEESKRILDNLMKRPDWEKLIQPYGVKNTDLSREERYEITKYRNLMWNKNNPERMYINNKKYAKKHPERMKVHQDTYLNKPGKRELKRTIGRDIQRKRQERLIEYKKNLPRKCVKCNEDRWWVIDFHHKDPSIKIKTIAVMLRSGYSWEDVILPEIAKCDPLCSNCHAEEHNISPLYSKSVEELEMALKNPNLRNRHAYIRLILYKLKNNIFCTHNSCRTKNRAKDAPWLIDFHHRNSAEKIGLVTKMAHRSRNWEKFILPEIAKCDTICRNCHRDIHHNMRGEIGLQNDLGDQSGDLPPESDLPKDII